MTMITTLELRAATNLLLSHLEQQGFKDIEIDADFYWDVPQEMRYDKYDEPKQHNVGQLSDDICELKRLVVGDAPPVGFALVWLGAVLRRIGEASKV